MPKTAGRRFLKRKIVTRHDQFSSDICLIFLRYRGPSNILHNKYTNVLCLLGTRGRENVFLKYKSKWNSAAYNLYTYEIKAGCSRTCCHSEGEKQPCFVNLNLFYKFRTPLSLFLLKVGLPYRMPRSCFVFSF